MYTEDALKCVWPETWVEHHGPVRLPDPNQGINQYLSSNPLTSPAIPPLQLCTKRSLQFYVACSTSCAKLGDPYNGLLPASEPTIADGCPNRVYCLLAWPAILIGSVLFLLVCALLALCVCGCCCLCCEPADLRAKAATPEVELEQLKEGDADKEEV